MGEGDFVYFVLMMTNLFGTTTTPSHLIGQDIISQHRFYLEIMDDLTVDFMSFLTPVPPALVKPVAEINLLRAARANNLLTHSSRVDDLLYSLKESSSAGRDAYATPPNDTLFPNGGAPVQHDAWSRSWEMLVDSFREAAILYLIISMSGVQDGSDKFLQETRHTSYYALRRSIDWLFEAKLSGGTHHKFIVWPMVVAGVEAVHLGDEEHLKSLEHRLLGVSRDLGTLAMRDAAVFLADLWNKSRLHGSKSHQRWDEIFSRSPLFLM